MSTPTDPAAATAASPGAAPHTTIAPATGASPVAAPLAAPDAMQMSPVERWRRALRALATVVADPEQTEQVLEFSIYANAGTMARRLERFFAHPGARRLYAEHRTIDSHTIDLDALAALPVGTLGHAYATFLRSRGLSPAVFDDAPREVSDPRMAYVVQRLRQTHDLWHVVTGQDTDPASEVALQAFTYAQLRAPSSLILAVAGTLRGVGARRELAREVLAAYRLGKRADTLAAFPWEDHWATPLATVRVMLGLPSQPRPRGARPAQRAAA